MCRSRVVLFMGSRWARGLIDAALYNTSPNTSLPYMFSLAGRPPFLNPYDCNFYGAATYAGPIPVFLSDGTPTTPDFTSTDGGKVLALVGWGIQEVDPAGGVTVINDGTDGIQKAGRPL